MMEENVNQAGQEEEPVNREVEEPESEDSQESTEEQEQMESAAESEDGQVESEDEEEAEGGESDESKADPDSDDWSTSGEDAQSTASEDSDLDADSSVAPAQSHQFEDLGGPKTVTSSRDLDFILDIPLQVTVEVGRTDIEIGDLLQLGPGSIIELDKLAGETLEVLVNDKLVARGEAVIINEKFGIRLTDVVSKVERIENLK